LSISSTFYDQLLHTQSARKTDNLTVFFALLGSARVKAGCRTLMKLQFGFVTFWQKDIGEKSASKMLMKLTPEGRSLVTSRFSDESTITQNKYKNSMTS